jgi:hypothetical protein
MEKEKDLSLTSVKIRTELFNDFKVECVRKKFSLNKLVNRAIYLYLNNEEFQKQLHSQNILSSNK